MRPWKVLVLAAALTTLPVTALPAAAAVEPDPLIGHGVSHLWVADKKRMQHAASEGSRQLSGETRHDTTLRHGRFARS